MENYKRMTDDELIETLRKCNITHGPIVGTTRTLYEKKLYEYERSKTRNQYPLGSYESKTQYRNRANDEDLGRKITYTYLSIYLSIVYLF
ncbi:hypothetical protein XENTR_v10020578 [Xenopus tropicalis]|nr:hypothetical protein XENTR_v10020578 [Xenopus tropicalis]